MSVESPNKTAHLWVFYCRNKKKDKQKRLPWQEAVFNVVDKTWQAIADRSAIWSNSTNHATDEYSGFYTIMADTDPGERVKDISQAIDYFIHCYDRVCEMIAGKEANVVTIRTAELADYAKTIRDAKRHAKAGEGKKQ